MANASISGLVSGLDTATIISQLMQVEAQPQTMLKNKVSSEQSSLSSLQSLNAKLQTIATKAGDLAKLSGWSPFTATSSSDKVSVRATAGASTSSVSFTVVQTARSHEVSFMTTAALTDQVTAAGSTKVRLDLLDGSTPTDIETGDGTLGGLVKALNTAGTGVRATTVKLDNGTYRLRVESEKTGEASDFTLTNTDGSDLLGGRSASSVDGQNAKITIGADTVSSAGNTFTGVVTGLDITLAPTTPAGVVDVTVGRDTKAMTDAVQGMVDAANAVLSDLGTLTSYNTATKKAGALAGDPTLRALRQELLAGVANGVDGRSLADLGVQLDRDGKVTFDAAKFTAAYTADPTGTANRFAGTATWVDDPNDPNTGTATLAGFTWRTAAGSYAINSALSLVDGQPATVSGGLLTAKSGTKADGLAVSVTGTAMGSITYTQGFAAKLAAIAERASDSTVGTVTAAISGRNSTIDTLKDAIDRWDTRLAKRRESLERQYTALEVALGKLQDQSSWLSGQIASLPSASSGS